MPALLLSRLSRALQDKLGFLREDAGRIRVEVGASPTLVEGVGNSGIQKGRSAGEISLLTEQGLVVSMQEGMPAGPRRR